MFTCICETCGKTFTYNYKKKKPRRFCSSICYGRWLSENKRGEKAPGYKGVSKEQECIICGNVFTTQGNTPQKFCSHPCYAKHKSIVMANPDYMHYSKHGKASTRVYQIWAGMKFRATNIDGRDASKYVGRGISVCDRWLLFENFYDDMGEPPKGMSLDRINNDGNYEPGNCRWATQREQSNNKRTNIIILFNGETDTLANWALKLGFIYETLLSRRNRGWGIERMLTTPIRK